MQAAGQDFSPPACSNSPALRLSAQLGRQRPLHRGPLTAVDTVAESQDKQHVAIYMSLGEKQEWPAGASLVV